MLSFDTMSPTLSSSIMSVVSLAGYGMAGIAFPAISITSLKYIIIRPITSSHLSFLHVCRSSVSQCAYLLVRVSIKVARGLGLSGKNIIGSSRLDKWDQAPVGLGSRNYLAVDSMGWFHGYVAILHECLFGI